MYVVSGNVICEFMSCLLVCTAKPKEKKLNQTHHIVGDIFTEGLASAPVEKPLKTKPVPHTDTNDDDIFADMFSSSSKTQSKADVSKPSALTVSDDIFGAEPAVSSAKTTRPTVQSKKASGVTNAFNLEDDDDDDIFAVKPSLRSSGKNSVAAAGSSTQKVCWCLVNCYVCVVCLLFSGKLLRLCCLSVVVW